jgi:hypothetical protein
VALRTEISESDWRLVPLIIKDRKCLGVALDTVTDAVRKQERSSSGNRGDWHFTHALRVGRGRKILIKLRLCIPYRCEIPEAWSCSLIMFNVKVDGIDYHVKAPDGRGGTCRGWHRHEWDTVKKKCDHLRNPLPDFKPGDTIESFVSSCCEVLNIYAANEGAMQ